MDNQLLWNGLSLDFSLLSTTVAIKDIRPAQIEMFGSSWDSPLGVIYLSFLDSETVTMFGYRRGYASLHWASECRTATNWLHDR